MKITKQIGYVVAIIAVIAVLMALPLVYISRSPHWSPTPDARRTVKQLRQTPKSEIETMLIALGNQQITLRRPMDDRYINKLLGSLRRMEVVYTKSDLNYGDDVILVMVKSHPINSEIRIDGRFEPNVREVSQALRSDDLGKIVYDIFKRKRMKPREQ